MDDFIISAKDSNILQERTKLVLQRGKEIDIFFKIQKSIFNVPEVDFCGFIIQENGIHMDLVKLSGVKD